MCLYPKLILNKKYQATKKNGGIIPPIFDDRVKYVAIGCGNCIECMKQKAREWQVRLSEEIRENTEWTFVTLTFSNESISQLSKETKKTGDIFENDLATLATRRFLERWRKKYKKSIKHWLITELGHNGTERIHMHGIINSKDKQQIENIWKYGIIYAGEYVNEKTINYIIKYVHKKDEKNKTFKPKILCSKGIGAGYLGRNDSKKNKFNGKKTNETYTNKKGYKFNLPKYYRNKIYTEEEKEKLWINLLDKEQRFVMGEKISIKESEEEYEKALKYHQKINKKLGYGDDTINWDKKMYRFERKLLKTKKHL